MCVKTMIKNAKANFSWRWAITAALSVFISAVFLSSLPFKFSLAIETQVIFGKLEGWANSWGAVGVFTPWGLAGPYAIGAAEALAAALLLSGTLIPRIQGFQYLGAKLAAVLMLGAVSFHLFTPLGIKVNNDGGALFYTAVATLISAFIILILRLNYKCAIWRALNASSSQRG